MPSGQKPRKWPVPIKPRAVADYTAVQIETKGSCPLVLAGVGERLRGWLADLPRAAFQDVRFTHRALFMPVHNNRPQRAVASGAGGVVICGQYQINLHVLLLYNHQTSKAGQAG